MRFYCSTHSGCSFLEHVCFLGQMQYFARLSSEQIRRKMNDYSFLPSGNFCRLLITFANSLDPDQD